MHIDLRAQQVNDAALLTIAGERVYLSEFKSIFMKNTKKDTLKDEKEIEEYLELFTNYKLKVREARAIGMDTTKSFRDELKGYRSQLTKPYLTDTATENRLLKEAYQRKLSDIKASHILVKVAPDADPKDTAIAYKRIMQLRNRIIKGEPFAKVARETSEVGSAKDDGGNFGWFTVFRMEYPFESGAYNAKQGEVTLPVRSSLGYHLVQVTGRREAMGVVRVAHILMAIQGKTKEDSLKAKRQIDDIYEKLKSGSKFEELAKQFSSDKSSGMRGGEIPPFKAGEMVDIYDETVYALKNEGDYSAPFLTDNGWFIVKKVNRKPVPPLDEIKEELKNQVQKDGRYKFAKTVFVSKIKKEYGFKENRNVLKTVTPLIADSYFEGKWKKPSSAYSEFLCSLGKKQFTLQDLVNYMEKTQRRKTRSSIPFIVNESYTRFVDEVCTQYEDENLEIKYKPFAELMKEYSDGILLFELTDKKVWSKAIKDTIGLQKFYEENRKSYMWEERADADIFRCKDDAAAVKIRKILEKSLKKGYTVSGILKQVNTDTVNKILSVEEVRLVKGEQDFISPDEWKQGLTANSKKDGKTVFLNIKKIIPPEPKSLKEARGIVTTDYQNFLEREWMDELRKKHPVVMGKDAVSIIKALSK